MKVLLINAKPSLVDTLAESVGIQVVAVWPQQHHFAHVPPPKHVPMRFYAGGRKLNFRAAWQLRRLLQTERPDVAHAFYGRALAHLTMAATGLHRRPKIVSYRGITSPLSVVNAGDWLSYRHPLVDAHACESEAVRRSLIRCGIPAGRCVTVYNTTYACVTESPGRPGLRPFDLPADAFVVGTVGNFRRVKGADLLLEAAIRCADLSDTYWLLIGNVVDPAITRLAADPRIRDRLRLVGHRADAAALISGADLFVMPSRAEALCQALLEAMHQGVCPVVSDVGGMKEAVRHGQDGLVVPQEDAQSLADAIRQLHGNRPLVKSYAASARQRVADTFTPQKMAERIVELYRHVLGNRRTRKAA